MLAKKGKWKNYRFKLSFYLNLFHPKRLQLLNYFPPLYILLWFEHIFIVHKYHWVVHMFHNLDRPHLLLFTVEWIVLKQNNIGSSVLAIYLCFCTLYSFWTRKHKSSVFIWIKINFWNLELPKIFLTSKMLKV